MQENYEDIVSRFEVLVAIRYDNRPLFISTVSQEMAEALGWIGSFTVPVGTEFWDSGKNELHPKRNTDKTEIMSGYE